MKQILRVTQTYAKNESSSDYDEYVVSSQAEIDEIVEDSTWEDDPWDKIVFGSEIETMASKIGGDWDEPTGVNFELINIKTAVGQELAKMDSIEAKITKYESLL